MKRLKITNKIGSLGEDIATKYLVSKGHNILTRNYLVKTGEIDIVSKLGETIQFTEVKSVSCESLHDVTRTAFNPLDNVHHNKLERLYRTIEIYRLAEKISPETPFQVNILAIYINQSTKEAKVLPLWNIVS
jgi:putative endonuclease